MSKNELIAKIEALSEWENIIAEAQAEAEALRDSIKEEMLNNDTEEMEVGTYIIRYTNIVSNRFDSTTFKRLYADLYKDFTKPVSSRRFTVSL